MNTVNVILEMGRDGYGVSFPAIENVFGFGKTVEEAKQDAKAALEFYIQTLKDDGKVLPDILQDKYELKFEFDVEALLKYIDGTVTKTAIAKASGINVSQLSHYSSGLKTPRRQQREKIVSGIHRIGRELLAIS